MNNELTFEELKESVEAYKMKVLREMAKAALADLENGTHYRDVVTSLQGKLLDLKDLGQKLG